MRGAVILALGLLAACVPSSGPGTAAPEPTAVWSGPIVSAEELEGEYRVADIAGIDMAALDVGFAVSITRDEIDVLANCVTTDWAYRFEGEQLVTEPLLRPTCRRALTPAERALTEGFTGALHVTRTPANGILIEGSGPAITLFSQ